MVLLQTVLDPTRILPADFFIFVLPFVFTFAVVYGLLDKVGENVFGPLRGKVNLALSLVFAFFVTAAAGAQIAVFLATILGNFVQLATGVIVLIILLQLVNKPLFNEKSPWAPVVLFIAVALGILLFVGSGGGIPGLNIDSNTATLIFWAVILLTAIYYVTQK